MKMKVRFFTVFAAALSLCAALFSGPVVDTCRAESKTADLVYVNWEEGVAYTHLARAVLEDKMGYEVSLTAADAAPGYTAVAYGDKDAFMEAWVPVLHKSYIERYGKDLLDLGPVFKGTQSGLVVPQYMYAAGVQTISDLLKPEVMKKLKNQITGIDSGAGVMRTTEETVMPAYGLDKAGYRLLPSSGPAMVAALKDAVDHKRWIVVTGWKPHSMFGYWDLTFLKQDKEQIWGKGNIHIEARKDLREDKPELAQFLENMILTNDQLSDLMVFIKESNKSTLEAAREWMNAHEDVVIPWIPAK